jgi:hypothetical protein
MAKREPWFPVKRDEVLNMAQVWAAAIRIHGARWNMFPNSLGPMVDTELEAKIAEAGAILARVKGDERGSEVLTAECNRIFGELEALMRLRKNTYFRSPPLLDEDYVLLLLKIPNRSPTPIPAPITHARIIISSRGVRQHTLRLGPDPSEVAPDPRSFERYDVAMGIYLNGQPSLGDEREMTAIPALVKDLPSVWATTRSINHITLPEGSSGMTAYYSVRHVNAKGEPGPWSDIVSRVIP